jgi:hypothetical protein
MNQNHISVIFYFNCCLLLERIFWYRSLHYCMSKSHGRHVQIVGFTCSLSLFFIFDSIYSDEMKDSEQPFQLTISIRLSNSSRRVNMSSIISSTGVSCKNMNGFRSRDSQAVAASVFLRPVDSCNIVQEVPVIWVFTIRFPTYMGPNYWGTKHKNSLHFWGSHPWTTNFSTENGSHLVRIRHFLLLPHVL